MLAVIFMLATALVGLLQATPIDHIGGLTNSTLPVQLGNLTWFGQVFESGPNETVSGWNLEHVLNQIYERNPSFQLLDGPGYSKRADDDPYPHYLYCMPFNNGDFLPCSRRAIQDGIRYLSRVPGFCRLGPVINSCGRVSCSNDAGIYFCNDANRDQYIYCSEIGHYAQRILDNCDADLPQVLGRRYRRDTLYSVFVTHTQSTYIGDGHC